MSRRKKRTADSRSERPASRPEITSIKSPPALRLLQGYAKWIVAGVAFLIAGALLYFFLGERKSMSPSAQYVGGKVCAECHAKEYEAWRTSDHALAMQPANATTVLGDFNNARFTYTGITSTFFRRDDKFYVNTDGPDGKLKDYEIKYTFGVKPLQQYLIEFPGGRLQALGIAWDSWPKEHGGQRWFHLYPGQKLTFRNPLHWTGIDQNWNYQCAECHSTHLKKRYDAKTAVYNTTWSDINVSCEACHGPGADHVAWAKGNQGKKKTGEKNGLVVQFTERRGVTWVMDETKATARRSRPRTSDSEIETCGRCHSRRAILTEAYVHGRPLLDTHLPALLREGLYYPDGQILDEVYEYASFLQSAMHAAGVTCSDCHNSHTLKLRAEGNGVCYQCHLPAKYGSPGHHHHRPDSRGASCRGCHMMERTYMVVDPRYDHSFRVPRPDLSQRLGTPNACNDCHNDKDVRWAANAFARWYKPARSAQERYTEALHAGRSGRPGAEAELVAVAEDGTMPAIVRATALAELGRFLSPKSVPAVVKCLHDRDPLVRLGALRALEGTDPRVHAANSGELLQDPVLSVRISAASLLAAAPPETLNPGQRKALDRAVQEYVASQQINADRPENQLNLGLFYARTGRFEKAEEHYRQAIKLDPSFAPAYVNLADLYRALNRDQDGEKVLREAIKAVPEAADVMHALGLLLVREKKLDEALTWLKGAAERAPENARYAYVYGVALNSTGHTNKALDVLATSQKRHPYDRNLLYVLVTMNRDAGRLEIAQRYAEKLAAVAPNDPAVTNLLDQPKRLSP
jgi:tetratricopeptide (TPR) repeat protein